MPKTVRKRRLTHSTQKRKARFRHLLPWHSCAQITFTRNLSRSRAHDTFPLYRSYNMQHCRHYCTQLPTRHSCPNANTTPFLLGRYHRTKPINHNLRRINVRTTPILLFDFPHLLTVFNSQAYRLYIAVHVTVVQTWISRPPKSRAPFNGSSRPRFRRDWAQGLFLPRKIRDVITRPLSWPTAGCRCSRIARMRRFRYLQNSLLILSSDQTSHGQCFRAQPSQQAAPNVSMTKPLNLQSLRSPHAFSCQLSNTLIACPPPSAPPKFLPPTWLNPVACGDEVLFPPVAFVLAPVGAPCAMPLYKYFMSVSQTSDPPSEEYMRCRMGVISD